MKLLFSFIIFLNAFKIFFQIENENISYFNYNSEVIKIYNSINNFASNSEDCNKKYLYPFIPELNKVNYSEFLNCIMNCSIYNISNLEYELNFLKQLWPIVERYEIHDDNIILIRKILNDSLNSGIIDDFYIFIKNNTSILNYTFEIIIETEKKTQDIGIIYEALSKIFNIDGIYDLLSRFYNQSREDFLSLIGIIANNSEEINSIYSILIEYFKDYDAEILQLFFDIIKNYPDENAIIIVLGNFFKTHKEIYKKLIEVIDKPEIVNFFSSLITTSDPYLMVIKDLIFKKNDPEITNLLLSVINKDSLVDLLTNIIINIRNENFLENNVGEFFSELVSMNSSYVDLISNLIFDLGIKINENNDLSIMTLSQVQESLEKFIKKFDFNKYNISEECRELFFFTFFDYREQDKDFFYLYFQKFLLDSSRNKGNLLTFDNCLNIGNFSTTYKNYIIYPAFIMEIINYPDLKLKTKNTSFYSKSEYIISACLPIGFKTKEDEEKLRPVCSEEDHEIIFNNLVSILDNADKSNVSVLYLYKNNVDLKPIEIIYGILAIIFLLLPVIINIVLIICKNVIIRKQKSKNLINELIIEEEKRKNTKMNKRGIIKADKNETNKRIIFPNWYLYLKEIFDIVKNGKELFNFSLNNTNYNNINGITYIKGLIGFAIILTIFGQTFIAIINLPAKVFVLYEFYGIMKSFFYPLLLFGYKYCPRILFSCSGYTLIYKFLCYIEQEESFCLPKFIFLQSYKYILLILVLVFFKYILYYPVILFQQGKRPIFEIFHYYLRDETDFFQRFFSFLFLHEDDVNGIKQHFIIYFYIPINEIFFFIFGTLLIFFGYKFKLRLDLIILILILICYCVRIIVFLLFLSPVEELLTTINYLFIDYGLIMVIPLFNLNAFLIGMYFGLINYSIQKGITELERKTSYNNILLQMSEAKIPEDNEEKKFMEKPSPNFKYELENRFKKFSINDSAIDEEKIDNKKHISKSLYTKGTVKNKLKFLREKDVNDINIKNNDKLEEYIGEEKDMNKPKKIEYSEKIKQMPFLITPIKFTNFHRKNKSKCFLNFFIIIAILLLLILIIKEVILTLIYIKPEYNNKNPDGSSIVKELSFEGLISNPFLNFIHLIDIEIVVFIVQWITFILYFKEFEIIRSFINHIYWSFFIKSYFSFTLVSAPIILFILYEDETVIKLGIFTTIIFTLINIICIIIVMIIFYSLYELPFKKAFKFLLKGKEILNIEEDEDEEEGEEEKEKDDDDEDEECFKDDDY